MYWMYWSLTSAWCLYNCNLTSKRFCGCVLSPWFFYYYTAILESANGWPLPIVDSHWTRFMYFLRSIKNCLCLTKCLPRVTPKQIYVTRLAHTGTVLFGNCTKNVTLFEKWLVVHVVYTLTNPSGLHSVHILDQHVIINEPHTCPSS